MRDARRESGIFFNTNEIEIIMSQRHIPEVSYWRFFRHSLEILKNPLPFHHNNFEKHGDTFQLNLGFGKHVWFSRDAGFAQYALQKNQRNYIKSPIQTEDLAKYVGQGLLTSNGQHWKKQRKMIQPAFHKKQLANLLNTMKLAIDTQLDRIEVNRTIDIFPIFNDLAFQTVVKSLFSDAVSDNEINRVQEVTELAQKMLVKELRQPYLVWWFKLSGEIKKHIDFTTEAREILLKSVNERRKSNARKDDLLDMLLDARYEDESAMDDQQLIDEILILFTAGHETTSNALSFISMLLALHPEKQEKVFAEIKNLGNPADDWFGFLGKCVFTQQVIEEAMRLYPPAYFIDRINIEEDEYEVLKIPKNTNILFSFQEIHRHSAYWENPSDFIPERFNDNAHKYSPYFAPFGAGPRMCIGNNFAMYEMIITVAEIVKRFKISTEEKEVTIKPLITLKPDDVFLKFERRI